MKRLILSSYKLFLSKDPMKQCILGTFLFCFTTPMDKKELLLAQRQATLDFRKEIEKNMDAQKTIADEISETLGEPKIFERIGRLFHYYAVYDGLTEQVANIDKKLNSLGK